LNVAKLAPGRTAFLDRDGTINEPAAKGEYVTSPEEIRLLPGAAEAIRLLGEHGAKVVVVTNQRGIALGKMSEADLRRVNERLVEDLARDGAHLDAILHCPHHEGTCECRKPGTGMFERAAREIEGVELEGAAMVGDTARDIEAGRRLGLTTVRIGSMAAGEPAADHEVADLPAAVHWLIDDAADIDHPGVG
jgi:D-glycero-D-manno-heptose 1,7-bisphosphate phosphatase